MKRFFTIIASALLVLAAASCDKDENEYPPYYKISVAWSAQSGTDFSGIFKVTDQYDRTEFASEKQALDAYNSILAKTKNASFSAPGDSKVQLSIARFISKMIGENMAQYYVDPAYTSPVGHIWDRNGSRDL